ncbi:MAG TPA: bifunctional nuclease domain-containing protein [Edaphocola sp.]|nr:bifunctional nuclease domain-containing protein [Edaphocola sp.]
MKKIELEIVALSSSATPTHYYAVVLGEKNGLRRLPIVIGAFEAQAIVVALEKIRPSRPLTHDLFHSFMDAFQIDLKEVLIHKLEEGIFYARLYCGSGDRVIEIDSRTSDALALAIRIGCPIYTYEDILKAAGMLMDAPAPKTAASGPEDVAAEGMAGKKSEEDLGRMSLDELNQLLNEVLEKEDYMRAVAIRDEIQRRNG